MYFAPVASFNSSVPMISTLRILCTSLAAGAGAAATGTARLGAAGKFQLGAGAGAGAGAATTATALPKEAVVFREPSSFCWNNEHQTLAA